MLNLSKRTHLSPDIDPGLFAERRRSCFTGPHDGILAALQNGPKPVLKKAEFSLAKNMGQALCSCSQRANG